jgi:multidrug resistance efflux pump
VSKEFQIRDGNLIASFDLENEDGDIDFCKLLKVSHGVADEIGMFVDYVVTNKIIKDQSKQIADLEAKLAESEKELLQKEKKIEDLMLCEFVATTLDFNKLSADNCRLREQLADIEANKEKEINRICKTHIEANAQLKQQLAEKEKEYKESVEKILSSRDKLVLEYNQDKISFAVEQLNQAKGKIKHNVLFLDCDDYVNVMEELDNQIKQLKEIE